MLLSAKDDNLVRAFAENLAAVNATEMETEIMRKKSFASQNQTAKQKKSKFAQKFAFFKAYH